MIRKYAPSTIVALKQGKWAVLPVEKVTAYPPGRHPDHCPINESWTAVKLETSYQPRWYGCQNAYIDSRLKMVMEWDKLRDEVVLKWEDVK